MLDFVFKPLREILGAGERDATRPFDETEHEIVDAVQAIHRASKSIDHEVQVIEELATSVGPLTESVNRLTATMADLVEVLGPLAAAEHGVHRAEHFLGFRRHEHEPAGPASESAPAAEPGPASEPGPPGSDAPDT